MSDGEDGAMDGFAAVATRDEQKASEAGRVVLRGVQVIVLDEIPLDARNRIQTVLDAIGGRQPCEAWLVEGAQPGTYDEAILNAADGIPGKYRAVKVKAWREQAPRHVEPPLS
jgi:hypothetical protein